MSEDDSKKQQGDREDDPTATSSSGTASTGAAGSDKSQGTLNEKVISALREEVAALTSENERQLEQPMACFHHQRT